MASRLQAILQRFDPKRMSRKRLNSLEVVLMGILATMLIVVLLRTGLLSAPERQLYDARAKTFQFFGQAPTTQIVHLDIDDRALALGRWPWPRTVLARMLDEIQLAEPKLVALDIIFSEKSENTWEPEPAPGDTTTKFREVDHDANLGDALGRLPQSFVPISVVASEPRTRLQQALVDRLIEKIDQTPEQLTQELSSHFSYSDLDERVRRLFLESRGIAMHELILRIDNYATRGWDEICQLIVPNINRNANDALFRQLGVQWDKTKALADYQDVHERPLEPGLPRLVQGDRDLLCIDMVWRGATHSGFADYLPLRDGVIRSVPLWVNHRGRMLPQAALVMACAMLDVNPLDPSQVSLAPDRVTLRAPSGTIEIPVFNEMTEYGRRGMFMAIPWFGPEDWEKMYGADSGRPRQHLSAAGILTILDLNDQLQRIQAGLGLPSGTTQPVNPQATEELQDSLKGIEQRRAILRSALKDKAVIIGLIATGGTDVVHTSIHPRCPGAVVHGTILNAILTGTFWTPASSATNAIITALLGITVSLLVARFPPWPAFFCTLAMGSAFTLFNGLVLFDLWNWTFSLAGPLLAMSVTWGAATLFRFLNERRERNQIEGMFRGYVDEKLVDYAMEHPGFNVAGERREMTVCFCDLERFTALSEQLREGIVPVVNKYMSMMVPVIRKNGGFVARLQGDGIMFFFGAPQEDENHALNAVVTALQMQKVMNSFNRWLGGMKLAPTGTRIGIGTADVIVGDAGSLRRPHRACAYTVFGDVVNLSARLEAVNKVTGTRVLVTERTVELLTKQTADPTGKHQPILFRPIARLCVVGQTRGVLVYEPLGFCSDATQEQLRLVEESRSILETFTAGRFEDCLKALASVNGFESWRLLRKLYQSACEKHLASRDQPFDGSIVLETK